MSHLCVTYHYSLTLQNWYRRHHLSYGMKLWWAMCTKLTVWIIPCGISWKLTSHLGVLLWFLEGTHVKSCLLFAMVINVKLSKPAYIFLLSGGNSTTELDNQYEAETWWSWLCKILATTWQWNNSCAFRNWWRHGQDPTRVLGWLNRWTNRQGFPWTGKWIHG